MDVFVIPIGAPPRGRYELYCEVPDDDLDSAAPAEAPHGFFKGMLHKFRATLHRVERERREAEGGGTADAPRSWTRRVRDRALGWMAERIAEQRLLWHLRRQDSAVAVYPEDLSGHQALDIVRDILRNDGERHRRWLAFDAVMFVLSGLLALVPGPNIVAYYFGFRVVGHYLSLRGARHGLDGVSWTLQPSGPLAELRRIATLPAAAREEQVRSVASRLRLEHLTRFFERVALPSA